MNTQTSQVRKPLVRTALSMMRQPARLAGLAALLLLIDMIWKPGQ